METIQKTAVLAICLAMGLAGCGGGGSSATAATAATGDAAASTGVTAAAAPANTTGTVVAVATSAAPTTTSTATTPNTVTNSSTIAATPEAVATPVTAPVAVTPVTTPVQVVTVPTGPRLSAAAAAVLSLDLANLASYANPVLPAYYSAAVQADDNTPPDNRVTNAVATLGRVLFYDKRLSVNNTVSCASCHQQVQGFGDTRRFSIGFAGGATTAHAMRLGNVRYYAPGSMFWDKRAATLEAQATQPIQHPVALHQVRLRLKPRLAQRPLLAQRPAPDQQQLLPVRHQPRCRRRCPQLHNRIKNVVIKRLQRHVRAQSSQVHWFPPVSDQILD